MASSTASSNGDSAVSGTYGGTMTGVDAAGLARLRLGLGLAALIGEPLLEIPLRDPAAIAPPAPDERDHEQDRAHDPQREPEQAHRRGQVAAADVLAPLLEQLVDRLAELVLRGGIEIRAVADLAEEPAERPAVAVVGRCLPSGRAATGN